MDLYWTADELVEHFLFLHKPEELRSRDVLEVTFDLVSVFERTMCICEPDRRDEFLAQCFVELLPAVERKLRVSDP